MLAPARAVLAAALLAAAPLAAQSVPVRGDVVDRATNFPVPNVDVSILRGDSVVAWARTDAEGRFAMPAVAHGVFVVRARRIGFSHDDVDLVVGSGLQPLRLRLEAAPTHVDSVEVQGDPIDSPKLLSYRLRREAKRQGIFMERSEFPKNAQWLSEAFRKVPGAMIREGRIGNTIRLRNCRPALWVDGIKMDNTEIDDAAAIEDVAAMEIYISLTQAPPQYQDRDTRCGSVVIWLL